MSADSETGRNKRPATARVFFALWPPAALADELADVARETADRWGGRATRSDTIHLTLAFLGDVPVSELPELYTVGERVRTSPFSLRIDRCGYWQHNRVFWAGSSEMPSRLDDLHRQLQAALEVSGVAPDSPSRAYTPHVTLVRRMPAARDDSLPTAALGFRPLDWPCASFVLVRSDLGVSGAKYTILREYPLV